MWRLAKQAIGVGQMDKTSEKYGLGYARILLYTMGEKDKNLLERQVLTLERQVLTKNQMV